MDYVPPAGSDSPGASPFPNSELRWYDGLTSVHGAPGSYAYGQQYEYLVPPARWRFDAGSSLTIILPSLSVPWYDPVKSRWNPETKIGDYVTFDSPLTLRYICSDPARPSTCSSAAQGAFFTWDQRGKTISMAGPHSWGTDDLPLDPSPWVEFVPEQMP
jgi:hypothetical protein